MPTHCFTMSVFTLHRKDKCKCQKYWGFFLFAGTRIKQICFLGSSFILDGNVAWYRKLLMRNLASVKMTFFSVESRSLTWPEDSSIGKLFMGELFHWYFVLDVKERCIKNAYIWNSYLIVYNLVLWLLVGFRRIRILRRVWNVQGKVEWVPGVLHNPEPLHYSYLQMQAVRWYIISRVIFAVSSFVYSELCNP